MPICGFSSVRVANVRDIGFGGVRKPGGARLSSQCAENMNINCQHAHVDRSRSHRGPALPAMDFQTIPLGLLYLLRHAMWLCGCGEKGRMWHEDRPFRTQVLDAGLQDPVPMGGHGDDLLHRKRHQKRLLTTSHQHVSQYVLQGHVSSWSQPTQDGALSDVAFPSALHNPSTFVILSYAKTKHAARTWATGLRQGSR